MESIKLSKVENVRMVDRYNSKNIAIGTLYITATHLIFVEPELNIETWILHMHISSIEKLPLTTTGSPLLIRCKTFLSITFVIPRDSECHDVYASLTRLHLPTNISELYCFSYSHRECNLEKNAGWDFYKLENEYNRMGVPNKYWSMCTLNEDYQLCETYPKLLFVPSEVNSNTLTGSSKFRSKGRLPVLSYLHKNMASICRCSQPLSGFNARCPEDEQMLEAIRRTNPNTNFMYVVDTRPKINAMANRATGKGYENEAFYENIKFNFLGIENIHIMRSSLQKLLETCEQKSLTMAAFLDALDSSGWIKHIRSILETSRFIASAVERGQSVVVHCSDGWDRTAQVCSIAAMILDPFYRTVQGYQTLIEKDWLSFGFKFSERCGHIQTDPKEISPIFTQFLDCTWQLMSLKENAFEFNENFLIALHDHAHSCQFGTFIGNCEKDRKELELSVRTYSLWAFIANNSYKYTNPLYSPEHSSQIIDMNTIPQSIRYWRSMYSRFESGVHPREPLSTYILANRDQCSAVGKHRHNLIKATQNIEKFIVKAAGDLNESETHNTLLTGANDKSESSWENQQKYTMLRNELRNNDKFLLTMNAALREAIDEIETVTVDWKPLRSASICVCLTPFDRFNKKSYCFKCGNLYCPRCIQFDSRKTQLYEKDGPKPICKSCFRLSHEENI